MTTESDGDTFRSELQKLYHAEIEIPDLRGDLSAAARDGLVTDLLRGGGRNRGPHAEPKRDSDRRYR